MDCRTPREVVLDYLHQPCTVQALVRESDGQGGTTESWDAVAHTLCHVAQSRGGYEMHEQAVADRLHGRAAYLVRLPYTTEVSLGDRIVTEGVTLDVVNVSRPPNGMATLVTAGEV